MPLDENKTPPAAPASPDILDELIDDAEMVSRVAVRLGRMNQADFYAALSAARQARESGTGANEAAANLQRQLSGAVANLAPITFGDLKSGWDPFKTKRPKFGAIVFGLIYALLIVAVALTTLIYNRAASVHAGLVELQSPKASEQLVKLVGMILTNQAQLKKSMNSGTTDALTVAVYQNLYDVKRADERVQAFYWLSGRLVEPGTMIGRLLSPLGLLEDPRQTELTPEQLAQLKAQSVTDPVKQYQLMQDQIEKSPFGSLDAALKTVSLFNQMTGIQNIHPSQPLGLDLIVFRLTEALNLLGLWVLPALYGMLGSAVFHMRRYLDSSVPDPSWLRSAYRTLLGGFAGVIVVWIWIPAAPKASDPAFATLSAFAVAFLMGFSTDIFFQALDRVVLNVSQWLSGVQKSAS